MDPRALQNIVETFHLLKDAYARQGPVQAGEIPLDQDMKVVSVGPYTLILKAESLTAYRAFMQKWMREQWVQRWSEDFIESKVRAAMGLAWNDAPQEATVFQALADELDTESPRFTVLIPLTGVDLQIAEYQLGPVKIIRLTRERLDDLIAAITAIAPTTLSSETVKEEYLAQTTAFLNSMLGTVCAEVVAAGDPERCKEAAEAIFLPAIDVLQLLTGILESSARHIRIDFRSAESSGFRPVIMLSEDRTHLHRHHERYGAAGQLVINEVRITQIAESPLADLVALLSVAEGQRSEVEDLLLRAVHWFSDGELQRNDENKLLSYVTCLEMFFSSGDGAVTSAIQDGVAYLLAQNAKDRVYLHRFVGEIYKHRSDASHSGEQFSLPEKLLELRILTLNVMAAVLGRRAEFPTKQSIKAWVFAQRMA